MVVIFSGYNQRAVVAFLRTLERDNIIYRIVASGESDSILRTTYKSKIIYVRKNRKLELRECLNAISAVRNLCNQDERILIAPSTEALNRFVLDHYEIFENNGCVIPLVDKRKYEMISDKQKFVKLCRKYNICTPNEYGFTQDFHGAVIAKPRKYYSVKGLAYAPQFLLTKEEYDSFWENHDSNDFIIQEYIPGGESYYLLFYFSRNGEVYSFSQENLVQQPNGKSIIAAKTSSVHLQKEIVDPYIQLFLSEKFYGLVMVEIRCYNGNVYMIEANPRFWGPSQLFCDAHYNLFECLLNDFGFFNGFIDVNHPTDGLYFWSGGILGHHISNENCVWHNNRREMMEIKYDLFEAVDIYRRIDTMSVYYSEKLCNLYQENSKHSGYQVLPPCLENIIDKKQIHTISRFEQERMEYILKTISLYDERVLDIGGNTGYFSIQSISAGAKHIDYYEGNIIHAEFVKVAIVALDMSEKISVHDTYYSFEDRDKSYDVCFCLNVLHHLGDDFGKAEDVRSAKRKMMECLNSMAEYVKIIVFQLGFNWKGNRNKPLFPHGSKNEMLSFLEDSTRGYWTINKVGIPEKRENCIIYKDLNKNNSNRDDEIGEFLNRPLIIMESCRFNSFF